MPTEFALNRRGGVPVRDQIAAQLELQILGGDLRHGQRLPSVRSLARRLRVHHNTVSAAYQDLVRSGHVELRPGSGVYVRHAGPDGLREARGLDEMIRLALHTALGMGYSGDEVRAAVERWLAAEPPESVVVVDPVREMGELLVHEVREGLGLPARVTSPEELERDPSLVAGSLVVVLPYHLDGVRRLAPGAAIEQIHLAVAPADREAILALGEGDMVLVVSHSPTVLPFATVFIRSLRGDELLVETRLLSESRDWKRLARASDLVFADALSAERMRRAGVRRLREVRVIAPAAMQRLRAALTVVTPGAARPRHAARAT